MNGTRAVLGIDLGTSRLKALLATPDGEVLGRGSAAYPVTVPAEGHAETDPEDWWRAARAAVREALASAADGSGGGDGGGGRRPAAGTEVAGLAVTGQMHGVVLADAAGTPVRPAILWLDRRAAAEAAAYRELPAEQTAPLGNRPSPGMAGPILRWLSGHEPGAVRRARWALQPKDWLRLRLTGEAATDPTDASGTLLFDLAGNAWSRDVIEALGLHTGIAGSGGIAGKLPEIREPADIAGRLLAGPAGQLGLSPGIPVAVGAADTAAALYAVCRRGPARRGPGDRGPGDRGPGDRGPGDRGPGDRGALLTLGTGGQWVVPEDGFRPTPDTNLFRAVGGGYYRLAASQNVGATLDWVRNLLGAGWDDLYGTAARPWRPDTPIFLPYLAAERWDEPGGPGSPARPAGAGRAGSVPKGAWAGLTLAHTRDDLLRAALDGVAFLLRERLEDLREAGHRPGHAILGGGGARHPAWRQLLADVLGLPLRPAPTAWLSTAGAAMVAAEAIGAATTGAEAGAAGTAVSRARSGYIKEEAVTPREQGAAGAAYRRFVELRRSSPTS